MIIEKKCIECKHLKSKTNQVTYCNANEPEKIKLNCTGNNKDMKNNIIVKLYRAGDNKEIIQYNVNEAELDNIMSYLYNIGSVRSAAEIKESEYNEGKI